MKSKLEKTISAVKYLIDVYDEVRGDWREKPDHTEQKLLEVEKEIKEFNKQSLLKSNKKTNLIEHFKELMPSKFQFHETEINTFINFMTDIECDESSWCLLLYSEDVKMRYSSVLCNMIKELVLPDKDNPFKEGSLQGKDPDNDYELGVFSTLGLIYHLQHSMNPG